ncbi:hypothetical protein D9M68_790470 [compost metagenome]
MHRSALAVEHLDAALGAFAGLFLDGEHTGPAAEKQAQVDIGRDYQPHLAVAGDGHLAVIALALVHAVLVAGQRHHIAQLAQSGQQASPFRTQAHGVDAETAGRQLGFTDRQVLGGIARTHARLLATQRLPGLIKIAPGGSDLALYCHGGTPSGSTARRQGELHGNLYATGHGLAVDGFGAEAPIGHRLQRCLVEAFNPG